MQQRAGGLTPDDDYYGSVVFAIAESPLEEGLIWAGTNLSWDRECTLCFLERWYEMVSASKQPSPCPGALAYDTGAS